FDSSVAQPPPHSFPTRRSSDLLAGGQHSGFRLGTVVPVRTVLRQVEARLHEDDLEVLHALPLVALSQTHHVVLHSTGRRKGDQGDRKSTRLNSSHVKISYAFFC